MKWKYDARSTVVIIGQDGEFADYDNPHGYIYGEVWYVEATNAHGDRYVYCGSVDGEEAARSLAFALDNGANDPETMPNEWRHDELQPVYGSDAYLEAEPYIVEAERQAALNPF